MLTVTPLRWPSLLAGVWLMTFLLTGRAAELPWYERAIVGMEVGPTGAQFGHSDPTDRRYCSQFSGREIVQRAVAAHGEYVVLWVRDGDYAYYTSQMLPKAPGLGERDPLREAVEEARSQKIPLIAYCVVQQGGHFLQAHPEWEMRGIDRKPIGRFCLNSGYLEAMKQLASEQLAYGIDGFHIDMIDQGFGPPYGCWCDTCQAEFRKQFGHPMPQKVDWDSTWDEMLAFRYQSSERFEKALAAHIKTVQPKATVDFNYHGNPPFSFEVGQRPVQHAGNGDFVTGETGVWGFSALTVGLNAEFYRASTPGKPFQVAMQRGVRTYHDQTTRPLNDLRWELFTLLAHGAFVTMVDKTGLEGKLDPVAYRRIGKAFEEARAERSTFGHHPVQEVGIYFSSRTRDWIGRENPNRYFASFLGAQKTCVQEHLSYGVVLDENCSVERLKAFRVILLPNAGILSSQEIAIFKRYVEEGGRMVVTGHSGQFDQLGRPSQSTDWTSLLGAKAVGRLDSLDNWVRFQPQDSQPLHPGKSPNTRDISDPLHLGAWADWPFLVKGAATLYEPTTAQTVGKLLKPSRTTRQREGKEGTEWPMSPATEVGPAILFNRTGQGDVLTFAGSPDAAVASEHALVEDRTLLANAVRFLNPEPRVSIQAPATVEVVITDDPKQRILYLHVLAYNSTPQTTPLKDRPFVIPGLIEDTPMFRMRVTTAQRLKSAHALHSTTKLRRNGSQLDATVEGIHEVITLHY